MRFELGLVLCVALMGCKKQEEARPIPEVDLPLPRPTDKDSRARNTLAVVEAGGAFEVTDGARRVKITLPQRPQLKGDVVSDSGVEAFNAQAVMPGGDVDVQFGVMTMRDGVLPADLASTVMDATPTQLAQATGGKLAKSESTELDGHPARIFEVVATDGRRLFGWYVSVAAQARLVQLNCIGPDTAKSRTACETIARSMIITK